MPTTCVQKKSYTTEQMSFICLLKMVWSVRGLCPSTNQLISLDHVELITVTEQFIIRMMTAFLFRSKNHMNYLKVKQYNHLQNSVFSDLLAKLFGENQFSKRFKLLYLEGEKQLWLLYPVTALFSTLYLKPSAIKAIMPHQTNMQLHG